MAVSTALRSPGELADRIRRDVGRNALRARNGIKLVAGTERPDIAQAPKDVVWERDRAQLWRYRSDEVRYAPPLLIVFGLVSRSYILDLSPGNSFVEHVRGAGFDVFLADWGVPDQRDAGNVLEDYVDGYLPAIVRRVGEVTGSDEVNVLGYCFGGLLSLLLAARHPELPIRSLTTMATPVDYTQMGLFAEVFRGGTLDVDDVLDDTGNVPPDVIRQAFRVLKPTADAARYATLLENLWSDRYVASYQAMTQWTSDHVPFPGAAARQCVQMLLRDNGMVTDRLRLGGEAVHLSDIRCPYLNVVAERDHIVPIGACAPVIDLVGSPERDELRLEAGHIGLTVGKTAARVTIPRIVEFLQRRSDVIA